MLIHFRKILNNNNYAVKLCPAWDSSGVQYVSQSSSTRKPPKNPNGFLAVERSRKKPKLLVSHKLYQPEHDVVGPKPLPLFITHGLLGSKSNWSSIAKAVARATNRSVVTFDARNHGDSPHSDDMSYELMAYDIRVLADHLQIPKFALLGHSMGGRSAMTYALTFSDTVEKLIVVDVSPVSMGGDYSMLESYVKKLMRISFDSENPPSLSEARNLADMQLTKLVPEKFMRQFLLMNLSQKLINKEIYWKPNLPVLLNYLAAIGDFPDYLLSKQTDLPTLFIKGENSLYIPNADLQFIRQVFTEATLHSVPQSGHMPHIDNTTNFMEVLLKFLNS